MVFGSSVHRTGWLDHRANDLHPFSTSQQHSISGDDGDRSDLVDRNACNHVLAVQASILPLFQIGSRFGGGEYATAEDNEPDPIRTGKLERAMSS